MEIRKATFLDLPEIINVHKRCFKNSFSSSIGFILLKKFYITYMNQNPDLFLIAEENNKIVGFCMGYLGKDKNLTKQFIKNNRFLLIFRCFFLTIIFNKAMWGKIFSYFKKKDSYKTITNGFCVVRKSDVGNLLSICVLESYRGTGISSKLIATYVEELKKKGLCYCALTVSLKNTRALSFYKKEDFLVYKENSKNYIMIKLL